MSPDLSHKMMSQKNELCDIWIEKIPPFFWDALLLKCKCGHFNDFFHGLLPSLASSPFPFHGLHSLVFWARMMFLGIISFFWVIISIHTCPSESILHCHLSLYPPAALGLLLASSPSFSQFSSSLHFLQIQLPQSPSSLAPLSLCPSSLLFDICRYTYLFLLHIIFRTHWTTHFPSLWGVDEVHSLNVGLQISHTSRQTQIVIIFTRIPEKWTCVGQLQHLSCIQHTWRKKTT